MELTIQRNEKTGQYRYVLTQQGTEVSWGQPSTKRRVQAEIATMRMYLSLSN
jgi:hypothetical protein